VVELRIRLFNPVIIHVALCFISIIYLVLFVVGPEGGIFKIGWTRTTLCVIGFIRLLAVLLTYSSVGVYMSNNKNTFKVILSILSVFLLNSVAFLIMKMIMHGTISNVLEYTTLTFNSPFFELFWYGGISKNLWTVTLLATLPSIMMFAGYLFPFKKSKS